MMHFPPFQISPYFRKMLPFPEKISWFSSAEINFWWPSFSHRPQISNFPPIFSVSVHSPCFAKIVISSLFWQIYLCFRQIQLLFTCFTCISFPPYFGHDAFMHHPMHVLAAPGSGLYVGELPGNNYWRVLYFGWVFIECRRILYIF